MSIKHPLSGKTSGTPLLAAWTIATLCGILWSYLHMRLFGPLSGTGGVLGGLLLLYVCQSMLLISDWRRRALWIGVYLLHIAPPFGSVKLGDSNFFLVQVIQCILLLGARQRVWAWLALAAILNPKVSHAWEYFTLIHAHTLSASSHWIPRHMLPPYFVWYPFGVQVLFGCVAAFLMPPVTLRKDADEGTKESL